MRKLEVPPAPPCMRPCFGSSRLFIHSVHVHLLVKDLCQGFFKGGGTGIRPPPPLSISLL